MKTTDQPTHHIAADGVFEPIDNGDTERFLQRLEDTSDIEIEDRLPTPVAVNVEAELDKLGSLRDRHWLNRILSTGVHDIGAMDAGELRILALQARAFEDRIRERGNLFSAEVNRREIVAIRVGEVDIPYYLKAKT